MTGSSTDTAVLFENRDGVVRLTLNRPKYRNALDKAAIKLLHSRLRDASCEKDIKVLVVRGAGGAFSAGADVKAFETDVDPADPGELIRDYYTPVFTLLRDMRVPTVASVTGACAGVGMSLALMCDLVIASSSAYFVQAFVNIGLVPDMGSSWMLPRKFGEARAKALMMLGERLPATLAADCGLIYKCVPDEFLEQETDEVCKKLARGPTQTYIAIRELTHLAWKNDLPAQIDDERRFQNIAVGSEFFHSAVARFKNTS